MSLPAKRPYLVSGQRLSSITLDFDDANWPRVAGNGNDSNLLELSHNERPIKMRDDYFWTKRVFGEVT